MTESIELLANSLYINATIISFDANEEVLVREPIEWVGSVEDKIHTVVEGDELTKLASKYYEKQVEDASKYWWVIADANNIQDPTDISDLNGNQIIIPNLNNFLLKI